MPVPNRTAAARLAVSLETAGWRPFLEWAVWVGLAAFAWFQIGFFDRELPHYRFGTAGWPRLVCLMIMAGATAQLVLRLSSLDASEGMAADVTARRFRLLHRLCIFALPLVFLWLTPRVGFYLASPVFTMALLMLQGVRRPGPLIGVTAVVWGLILLIFTRLFFVPLPEGQWDGFFEVNIAIVDFVRWGL